jgi:hypothetical protein
MSPDTRRLWQFAAGKERVHKGGRLEFPVDRKPPAKWVRKTWVSLLVPRLNIGGLPAEHVFMRTIQLPASDPSELAGLVEFQLERISPLPTNQIVWTAESIPHADGKQQTAVVAIVERRVVEEFLGRLESTGFVADRLEIPLMRELRASATGPDGLWLLLRKELNLTLCLTAWWSGGVLREVSLSQLSAGAEGAPALIGQLTQSTWAAEMGGWLSSIPKVFLVADAATSSALEGPLTEWSGQSVEIRPALNPDVIAELTARHALRPPVGGLIPEELLQRNRQQFIDGIWMRGLGVLGIVYAVGVLGYLVWLHQKNSHLDDERARAVQLGKQYTNTLQLKEQVAILEDQVTLKFAALDSWKAASDSLPTDLVLTSFTFDKGKTLTLTGTVPQDSTSEVGTYEKSLRAASAGGQPLFTLVKTDSIEAKGQIAQWRISAQLRRSERQ